MLQKKVKSGLIWNLLNQGVSQLLFVWFSIYLARLLGPEAYGLVGMVAVFSGFANLFVDFGFGSALIYDQNINNKKISSVFWTNLFIAIALYGLFYVTAPFIEMFYNEPKLTIITRVVTLGLVINSMAGVPNTLLSKKIDFKAKIIASWFATLLSYGLAFYMAFEGYGVWSLVFQGLSLAFFNLILVWYIAGWSPLFYFSWSSIKGLFSYGSGVMGTNMLGYLTRNVDNLIIGKVLGNTALGLYSRSYGLMMLPITNITGVFRTVMFPAFAIIQNDKPKMAAQYLRVIRLIAFITFPSMVLLHTIAEEFVVLFLGNEWLGAIPIIKVLSFLGAVQSVLAMNGVLYNATGNAVRSFKVNLYLNLILIPSWLLGMYFGGLMGLVTAYFVVGTIGSLPILNEALSLVGVKLKTALEQLKVIMVACIVLYLGNFVVDILALELVISLFLKCLIGGALYLLAMYLMNKEVFLELRQIVKGN